MSDAHVYVCPHCEREFRREGAADGGEMECPWCLMRFEPKRVYLEVEATAGDAPERRRGWWPFVGRGTAESGSVTARNLVILGNLALVVAVVSLVSAGATIATERVVSDQFLLGAGIGGGTGLLAAVALGLARIAARLSKVIRRAEETAGR